MCFASNSMSSPRAQRRFVDLQHARTVIQIGSKPPFHYRRFHVIVSGRDDAHVDPAWKRGRLAVLRYALQEAQEACLAFERQVANFIEGHYFRKNMALRWRRQCQIYHDLPRLRGRLISSVSW
jgi:hypothetical protein